MVAQVLAHLRTFMTPRGMSMWFDAERDQLDGRTPLELLEEDEAAAYPRLIGLAKAGVGSWRVDPRPRAERWLAFRQVATDAAPLCPRRRQACAQPAKWPLAPRR